MQGNKPTGNNQYFDRAKPIKFSDAKTFEIWLPSTVTQALGGLAKVRSLVIVEDKEEVTYYVDGVHVYTRNLEVL